MPSDNKGSRILSIPIHICNTVSAVSKKLPFYIVQIGQSICDKNHCVYYADSNHYTILLTLDGGCNFVYRNKQLTLKKGDLVFFDSKEPQYFDEKTNPCWN